MRIYHSKKIRVLLYSHRGLKLSSFIWVMEPPSTCMAHTKSSFGKKKKNQGQWTKVLLILFIFSPWSPLLWQVSKQRAIKSKL